MSLTHSYIVPRSSARDNEPSAEPRVKDHPIADDEFGPFSRPDPFPLCVAEIDIGNVGQAIPLINLQDPVSGQSLEIGSHFSRQSSTAFLRLFCEVFPYLGTSIEQLPDVGLYLVIGSSGFSKIS